jgi:hypothetical protein
MLRKICGIVGGVVAWFLIASLGNLILRANWPGYVHAEAAMTFGPGMLMARLLIGAISSLCAGLVASWITNRSVLVMKSLAVVLLIMLLPVITLWESFPPWYHVVFLTSLPVLTLLGGSLYPRRRNRHRSTNSR